MLYHCCGSSKPDRGAIQLGEQQIADVAASFQEAVVDVLVDKVMLAAKMKDCPRVAMGGGVACNSRLRERLAEAAGERKIQAVWPPPKFCVDNAAMTAGLGWHLLKLGRTASLDLDAIPRLGSERT